MTALLEPTVPELEDERANLLAVSKFSEEELRVRDERYSLTPEESRILRRLTEIRFLLGEGS